MNNTHFIHTIYNQCKIHLNEFNQVEATYLYVAVSADTFTTTERDISGMKANNPPCAASERRAI